MARSSFARILIRGGGEMGSGVAWRLSRCGFAVVIAETERPTAIRRWVSFSEAIYDGEKTVEGITAVHCEGSVDRALADGAIPVVICPDVEDLGQFAPDVIVDAILAKRNTGVRKGLAARVIGLGPGFVAGIDVDCVIETNRGPDLGRVLWKGPTQANTGIPGLLGGETVKRVLRAPASGTVESARRIGDRVGIGDVIARVADLSIHSELNGIVRGLIRDGTQVIAGMKIGDIDPRGDVEVCRRISDKALAIAGGVVEAILSKPLG
ncbi:MAG: EF2563 family selenium-dependent molybdenum hydroxylase system protein [candidate division Zixibacteria bacterium]|nr:EF2563 family selenium-dependent molybdenum hydroxylase system protein [candidate division Zixibacteria bacterium]